MRVSVKSGYFAFGCAIYASFFRKNKFEITKHRRDTGRMRANM